MNLFSQQIKIAQIVRFIVIWSLGIALAGFFTSCNSSRALTKKGTQLREAGLYADAATFYYNALIKKSTNVDARIGLSKTAQKVCNDMLSEFSKARAMGATKKAVYAYEKAARYREKIARVGVELDAPGYLTSDFKESKMLYVKQLYDEGNNLLSEKKFAEAEDVFRELARLEPNYKDVGQLQHISINEPLYISGTSLFDARQWRKAYYPFDAVYQSDPAYKDVAILRSECLDKGQYPVAILPFTTTTTRRRALAQNMQAFVLTSLSAIDDPFLKIVERDNMDAILKEQRLNLSGVINQQSAAQAGNLLGAKAILTGIILDFDALPGKMRVDQRDAYVGYRVKEYNKEEGSYAYVTHFKPVEYTTYYNTNAVKISFQYKLVSLETGEILFSQVVNKTFDADVYYGTFRGEITALYPADKQGVVTENRARKQLINLMRAPRTLKSIDQLTTEAYQFIGGDISNDLLNLIRQK